MKNAVLYARVSSKEQEQSGFSIPAQKKLLEEYAIKEGVSISKRFVDVETAKSAGRKQFGEMITYLRSNEDVRLILVEKTDRLYRNFKDYVLVDDLDREIHLVKEGEVLSHDSRSHVKFIHGIKLLMAKNYIDNLSEEVKKGLKEKAEQGEWPTKAPLGYLNNKESCRIMIDPERAPMIKELFREYSTGRHSISSLHERAKELGLRFRNSGSFCSRSNVDRILKNPIYTGMFRWKGRLYPGIHEAIISMDLFDEVQRVLQSVNKPKSRTREFAYKGLLVCGYCGCSITAEIKKGKYIYYRCTNGRGKCEQKYVREEDLAGRFAEIVKQVRIDADLGNTIKLALQDNFVLERKSRKSELIKLRREIDRQQTMLEKAYIDKTQGNISSELWEGLYARTTAEQDRLRAALHRLELANRDYLQEGISFIDLATNVYTEFQSRDSASRAKLLRSILSNCTMKGLKLYPTYKKPFDLLVDRSNSDFKLAVVDYFRTVA